MYTVVFELLCIPCPRMRIRADERTSAKQGVITSLKGGMTMLFIRIYWPLTTTGAVPMSGTVGIREKISAALAGLETGKVIVTQVDACTEKPVDVPIMITGHGLDHTILQTVGERLSGVGNVVTVPAISFHTKRT